MNKKRKILGVLVAVAVLAAVAVYLLPSLTGNKPHYWLAKPIGIMGTDCELTAVAAPGQKHTLPKMIGAADITLRSLEAKMSVYLKDSEISRLNQAQARMPVTLSPETMEVLLASRKFFALTGGTFDVTCKPIVDLWKRAAKNNRLPSDNALAQARKSCGWDKIVLGGVLGENSVEKLDTSAGVDLGGIAKGYAIDLAVKAMKQAGAIGGIVNVGGDVRCFGHKADGGKWHIAIKDPFKKDAVLATIALTEGAVCTSGNYRRYRTIGTHRFSHIVDPRTARPAQAAASVTVVAPTATQADAWATALSVLGEDGLFLLPDQGIEAMLIIGTAKNFKVVATPNFAKLLINKIKLQTPTTIPATTKTK